MWICSYPTARFTVGTSRPLNTLASLPPPEWNKRGVSPIEVIARCASCTTGSCSLKLKEGYIISLRNSHSAPCSRTVVSSASRMEAICSPTFSCTILRASASNWTWSHTTFVGPPPANLPIFAVVSLSIRPSFIAEIALLATWIALMPSSGFTPAWADLPKICMVILAWVGAATAIAPTSPLESRAKPKSASK